MKKQLLTALAITSAVAAFAQLPVSTALQNKKVVLEEFTGIYCQYCPDGHAKANAIYQADPNNVVLVNIHSGGYANPGAAGDVDLRTPEGQAIDDMPGMLIAGYPAGTVNRRAGNSFTPNVTSQTAGGMALSRGTPWTSAATSVKTETAYCNIALQGTIDVQTRVLTVVAEVYYTGNSPESTNKLNIFLLENYIKGPQVNSGNWNPGNYDADGTYNHNHALRKALTGNFGEAITTTSLGSLYTTTVTYNIPQSYGVTSYSTPCILGNLEIVAFVTETDANTINAAHGVLHLTNFAGALDVAPVNLKSVSEVCAGNIAPSFKFMNNGSTPVTEVVFSYSVNGTAIGDYTWSDPTNAVAPVTVSKPIFIPEFNFTPLEAGKSNTLTIDVVSVNNANDEVAANNIVTNKTIKTTTVTTKDEYLTMEFTQDRYGSESTWTLYDEVTAEVIETDGPFENLSANGTLLHTKDFYINLNTCYKLQVTDAYGDGINSGFGVGGYKLKAGTKVLISSNGKYGSGEIKVFRNAFDVGVAGIKMNVNNVSVFPNPAYDAASLSIELSQNETLNISVMNSLGQVVYTSKAQQMDAGVNNIKLNTENWTSGVYFVNISSEKGSISKKLSVSK